MSKEKPRSGSKTQLGYKLVERNRALEDTLPAGAKRAATPPPPQAVPLHIETGDLMTSAPVSSIAATAQTSGAVTLSGERVSEPLARELIVRRMAQEGIALVSDFALRHDDLLVTLDGFDSDRRVGFQFISHADEDVVTDFDLQVEQRVRELTAHGMFQILIIHDYEAPDADAVLARVDSFLAAL